MSIPSFLSGIQASLVLTALFAETCVGQESAQVPLIVPYEKAEMSPPEGAEWLAEPLPVVAGQVSVEPDMSVLAPDYYGDIPEMGDAVSSEPVDSLERWLIPGLDRPFGESSLLPVVSDGFDRAMGMPHVRPLVGIGNRTDLQFGARTSMAYDSNVRRSAIVAEGADKSDWILSVAPAASYGWKAGHWTGEVAARVSYDTYTNNDRMGGLGYSLGAGAEYDGGRWQAGVISGTSRTNGGNRYLGGYTEQMEYHSEINASYEFSPKTLLDGSLSYRLTDPRSERGVRTEALEGTFAGLWKYSRLLELGPGFRYRWEASDSTFDRVTVGPLLRTRYRVTGKTALDADLGINFFDSDGSAGDTDAALFTRLGIHYQMTRIWNFDFSMGNDSVADEAGGYRDTFQFRAGVSRPIRRADWRLGIGYEKIDRDGSVLDVGDSTSFSVDTSLAMKVLGDRADMELFMLWREQQERGGGSGDWSGTQVGMSLGAKF